MATEVSTEGTEYVPRTPLLVLPNRLDLITLRALESALGGEHKVAWLVESTLRPTSDILAYISKRRGGGILFSYSSGQRNTLPAQIQAKRMNGQHVVLLTGQPSGPQACPADVPAALLHYVLDSTLSPQVLPVYVGMYTQRNGCWDEVTTSLPYTRAVVSILPTLDTGAASARALAAVWSNASAEQVQRLADGISPACLAHVLLHSLLSHPHAAVIDGVNGQYMSYRRLLALAVPLARRLRRHIINRRLGIILPPGRLSVIANTACLLAGITPVNVDFNLPPTAFTRVTKNAEITRFISGRNFEQKQENFPWPPPRDVLYIDDLLTADSGSLRFVQDTLTALLGEQNLRTWVRTPEQTPDQEALVTFYTGSEAAGLRGVVLSHRAVLTGLRLTRSRLGNGEVRRVLSCLPYHHRTGLLLGLIFPLLSGLDIVTYPDPFAGKRICELVGKYRPQATMFLPEHVPHLLAAENVAALSCAHYLLVSGLLSVAQAQRAYAEHHLYFCQIYHPLQSAAPIAIAVPPPTEAGHLHIPCGGPGTAGQLLLGCALRIAPLNSGAAAPPPGSPGLVELKSPALFSEFTGGIASQLPTAASWVRSGDIGYLQEDGQLVIGGTRDRFSCIEGELISHSEVEHLLTSLLPGATGGSGPCLAIVALRSGEGGDDVLVLLSTLHRAVGPHDVITLRYTLANARHSTRKAPQHIVPLRAIPQLPGGNVNYELCRLLASRALGMPPSQ